MFTYTTNMSPMNLRLRRIWPSEHFCQQRSLLETQIPSAEPHDKTPRIISCWKSLPRCVLFCWGSPSLIFYGRQTPRPVPVSAFEASRGLFQAQRIQECCLCVCVHAVDAKALALTAFTKSYKDGIQRQDEFGLLSKVFADELGPPRASRADKFTAESLSPLCWHSRRMVVRNRNGSDDLPSQHRWP